MRRSAALTATLLLWLHPLWASDSCCELRPSREPVSTVALPPVELPQLPGCHWLPQAPSGTANPTAYAVLFVDEASVVAVQRFDCWNGRDVMVREDAVFLLDAHTGGVIRKRSWTGSPRTRELPNDPGLYAVSDGKFLLSIDSTVRLLDAQLQELKVRDLLESSRPASDRSAWQILGSPDGRTALAICDNPESVSHVYAGRSEFHRFSTANLADLSVHEDLSISNGVFADDTLTYVPHQPGFHLVQQRSTDFGPKDLCPTCGGVPIGTSINGVAAIARADHSYWLVAKDGTILRRQSTGGLDGVTEAVGARNALRMAVTIAGPIPNGWLQLRHDPVGRIELFETAKGRQVDSLRYVQVADRSENNAEHWPEVKSSLSPSGKTIAVLYGSHIYIFALH